MARDISYHDYIVYDVLGHLPGITSKQMFGGWGIYRDKIIFAIITEGGLYFRMDDEGKEILAGLGSCPFTYMKQEKEAVLKNYWLIPEEILENKEAIEEWVERAVTASSHR